MKHNRPINNSLATGLMAVASQLPTLTDRIHWAKAQGSAKPLDGICKRCGDSGPVKAVDTAVYGPHTLCVECISEVNSK